MKKFLLFLMFIPLAAFVPHKFYVTNNIVEYNARTGIYEVTCKIFTDDLETAVSPNGQVLHLGEANEDINANMYIFEYLQKHMKVQINSQPILFKYIGKEVAPDLTHVYMEFQFPDPVNVISVEHDGWMEHFSDQKNIIDIRINGWNYTMILTKDMKKETKFR